MKPVNFRGLRGKGLLTKVLLPLNLLRAFWQSLRAVRQADPAVVLGLGGYITFPGGMMAVLLGKPLVLHEQNSVAGLANRVLARVADRIMVAFPGTLSQARWSGNPVAADIAAVAPPEQRYRERRGQLRVLVVGGSLGARGVQPGAAERLRTDAAGAAAGDPAPERQGTTRAVAGQLPDGRGRGRDGCLRRRHGSRLRATPTW